MLLRLLQEKFDDHIDKKPRNFDHRTAQTKIQKLKCLLVTQDQSHGFNSMKPLHTQI